MGASSESQETFEEIKSKVRLYLDIHRYDAAEKVVRNAISEHGDLAHLHHLLGLVYHKQSRFPEALLSFRKAVRINPSFIEASLNLAVTLCDLSQYEEAFRIFEEFKQQNDFHYQVPRLVLGRIANHHTLCGNYYAEVGMLTEAMQEYRRALTLFPNLQEAKLALARIYMRAKEVEKAKKELEELVAVHPTLTEAHNLLGLIHQSLGQSTAAKDSWTRARQSVSDDPTATILLEYFKQPTL